MISRLTPEKPRMVSSPAGRAITREPLASSSRSALSELTGTIEPEAR